MSAACRRDGNPRPPAAAPAPLARRTRGGLRSWPGRIHSTPMITHPDKVLFPDSGVTKGELGAYYAAVAAVMLPHVRGRPITMERYPAGIEKKGFIQKDVSKGFPDWLERVEVPKRDGK